MKTTPKQTTEEADAPEILTEKGFPTLNKAQLELLFRKRDQREIYAEDVGILNLEWVIGIVETVSREWAEQNNIYTEKSRIAIYMLTMVKFSIYDFTEPGRFAEAVRLKLRKIRTEQFFRADYMISVYCEFIETPNLAECYLRTALDTMPDDN